MIISSRPCSVHPHVCGEHFRRGWRGACAIGSSPRVWGTFRNPNTKRHHRAVHPHVCGEHASTLSTNFPCIGSSPRVWGTCSPLNTLARRSSVHPHVCGEHVLATVRERAIHGSSTCVGNMLRLLFKRGFLLRFIPTCVGNMLSRICGTYRRAVHPHVCGEHVDLHSRLIVDRGSSPRVWGTSIPRQALRRILRFIPTCVGNMQYPSAVEPLPRGSSPRVWGTCACSAAGRGFSRFIPTCVGNMRKARRVPVMVRFIPTCVGNIKCPPS